MATVQKRFGKKNFLSGITLLALSSLLIGLTVYRVTYQMGKISLNALLAAPVLFFAGLYQIWSSAHTSICSQCNCELRSGSASVVMSGAVAAETTPIDQQYESWQITKQPTSPYHTVEFAFCPACVSIGVLRRTLVGTNASRKTLPELELTGPIVRVIKNKLLL